MASFAHWQKLMSRSVVHLVQPVAMGILLGYGWHGYIRTVRSAAVVPVVLSMAAGVFGFIASTTLGPRSKSGQEVLRRNLFWMSCTVTGGLEAIAQVRLRFGSDNNDDAMVLHSILSSACLGVSLPHVAGSLKSMPHAEVVLPFLLALLLTEAVCSTADMPAMRLWISVLLLFAGLRGILGHFPEVFVSRGPQRAVPPGKDRGKEAAPVAEPKYDPFFPATVLKSRRYSPHYLVSKRARSASQNGGADAIGAESLVDLVDRFAELPPRRSNGPGGDKAREGRVTKRVRVASPQDSGSEELDAGDGTDEHQADDLEDEAAASADDKPPWERRKLDMEPQNADVMRDDQVLPHGPSVDVGGLADGEGADELTAGGAGALGDVTPAGAAAYDEPQACHSAAPAGVEHADTEACPLVLEDLDVVSTGMQHPGPDVVAPQSGDLMTVSYSSNNGSNTHFASPGVEAAEMELHVGDAPVVEPFVFEERKLNVDAHVFVPGQATYAGVPDEEPVMGYAVDHHQGIDAPFLDDNWGSYAHAWDYGADYGSPAYHGPYSYGNGNEGEVHSYQDNFMVPDAAHFIPGHGAEFMSPMWEASDDAHSTQLTAMQCSGEGVTSLVDPTVPDPGPGRASQVRRGDTNFTEGFSSGGTWGSQGAPKGGTLCIEGVEDWMNEGYIADRFASMAYVKNVTMVPADGGTPASAGYAYVEFATEAEAAGVMERLAGGPLRDGSGRLFQVSWADVVYDGAWDVSAARRHHRDDREDANDFAIS